MTLPTFNFYNRSEYFTELVHSARQAKAGDSITVMAMVFDPSVDVIKELAQELAAAAERNVTVSLIIDAYSFLLSEDDKPGPLLLKGSVDPAKLSEPFKYTYSLLEAIRVAGGNYHIINQPKRAFTLPFAGRSHIKLAIINDQVFLGGCNFDNPATMDLMVSWQDATAADKLHKLLAGITSADSVKQALDGIDQTLTLDNGMRIFIDSGVRKQSLIMQQAHKLIDEAQESVMITCQYFPGGQTAQRLLAAHKRGVKVTIHFSPPSIHGSQAPGQWLYNQRERLRLPASFFKGQLSADQPALHAKIIATESAVLLGSHNYVQAGVSLGTAEIALLVNGPGFATDILHNVARIIKPSDI